MINGSGQPWDGPYATITAKPCKTLAYLKSMRAHGKREDKCDHVDHSHPRPEFLFGTPNVCADLKAVKKAQGAKCRKGGPYGSHILLKASRQYFTTDGKEFSAIDEDKVKIWVEVNLAYVKERFGDILAHVRLDRDETTPHIDVFIAFGENRVTRTGKSKVEISHNAIFPYGSLGELQTEYAERMTPLGLKRGKVNSEAKQIPPKILREMMAAQAEQAERDNTKLQALIEETAAVKAALDAELEKRRASQKEFERRMGALDEQERLIAAGHDDLARRKKFLEKKEEEVDERRRAVLDERRLADAKFAELEKAKRELSETKAALQEDKRQVEAANKRLVERENAFRSQENDLQFKREQLRRDELRASDCKREVEERLLKASRQESAISSAKLEATQFKESAENFLSEARKYEQQAQDRAERAADAFCFLAEAVLLGEIESIEPEKNQYATSDNLNEGREREIALAMRLVGAGLRKALKEKIWSIRDFVDTAERDRILKAARNRKQFTRSVNSRG